MADIIFLGTSNDWGNTANWSTATVPVNGDDVFFNSLSEVIDVTTGLDQSAVALNSLTIDNGFEGTIGDGTDLNLFLQIGAINFTIGGGEGNGSQRLNIDAGSVTAATIDVLGVGSTGADQNFAPLRLKANNAATNIQINGESSNVSIFDQDDAAGIINEIDIILSSTVLIGRGCTYTNFNQIEGTTQILEATGTINVSEGTVTLEGTTAITAVVQTGGIVISNTTGTIALYTGRSGLLDTTQSALPRTINTLTKSPGFTFDRHRDVIVTNDDLDPAFQTFEISIN